MRATESLLWFAKVTGHPALMASGDPDEHQGEAKSNTSIPAFLLKLQRVVSVVNMGFRASVVRYAPARARLLPVLRAACRRALLLRWRDCLLAGPAGNALHAAARVARSRSCRGWSRQQARRLVVAAAGARVLLCVLRGGRGTSLVHLGGLSESARYQRIEKSMHA